MSVILALAVPVILAVAVLVAIGGGLWLRKSANKGIGWQFIRYNTIISGLLLGTILALNDALTDGIVGIISGSLAFAFGKSGESE